MSAGALPGFVDLHAHLLPGLDDGPATATGTLALLRVAHRGGVRSLVATPHMYLPPYQGLVAEAVVAAFERLVGALTAARGRPDCGFLADLTIYLGAENYLCSEFLAALDGGRLITINRSRYLLVEFPPFFAFEMAVSGAERILAAGLVPVIAHVERYDFLRGDARRLAALADRGCVLQLDAATLLGERGRAEARRATDLLRRDLVHVVASDAHDSRRRPPNLDRAYDHLNDRGWALRARRLMWENPTCILADQLLTRGEREA